MTHIRSLYPDVRLNCPGAPDIAIARATRRAVRDFLIRSEVWTSELVNPMPYTQAAAAYDPQSQAPVGTTIASILSVRWRPTGQEILFLTKDQLTESFPGWETETDAAPEFYTLPAPSVARLYPIAEGTVPSAVEMTVALTLDDNQVDIPSWLYFKYDDDLVAGALGILYAMPRQEWTDLKLAGPRALQFEGAVALARSAAAASHGKPTYEVSYGGI